MAKTFCRLELLAEKCSDDGLHMKLVLPSDTIEEGQSIPGKDIYTIGVKTPDRKNNGATPRDSVSKAHDSAKQLKRKETNGVIDSPAITTAYSSSHPVRRSSRRRTRMSDSEDEVVGDDEDVTALASRLNRGGNLEDNFIEDYFTAQSAKSGNTSDHTLSKLTCPRLDVKTVHSALSTRNFDADLTALFKEHQSTYRYWLFQMSHGFNILLYGLGSKKALLDDFCKKFLSSSCYLVVNGFFPGVTIKNILTLLSSELLDHSGTFKSNEEHAHFIQKSLEDKSKKQEIFLVVHNIDGSMLRPDSTQTPLSILAHSPSIHVLATIDHINAPLIWDHKKLSRFNWLWHDVTTYSKYREESSYENSLVVQKSSSLELSSLIHVTRSLTPNARSIFEILARYQLEKKNCPETSRLGMSFNDLYRQCREKFLVNSDLTLRTQLTEFRDHKLLKSRKGPGGVEHLIISVENGILGQFVEDHCSTSSA